MVGGMAEGGMHDRHDGGQAWEGGGVRGRRDGHCSGRYASYWNAFLFILFPFPDQVLSFMLKRCLKFSGIIRLMYHRFSFLQVFYPSCCTRRIR